MNCPKCNAMIPDADVRREAARLAGGVKSEKKARTSAANGRKAAGVRWEVWGPQGRIAHDLSRGDACSQTRELLLVGVDAKVRAAR